MLKTCTRCKEGKDISCFAKDDRATTGLCACCKMCQKIYNDSRKSEKAAADRLYREKNRALILASKKQWAFDNREKKRESNQRWAASNPEKVKLSLAKFHAANPGKQKEWSDAWRNNNKEVVAELGKAWRRKNIFRARENLARRRANKKQATPSWANKEKIAEFYFAADFLGMITGEWYHVDHIVPINGKTVRGFHVKHNLQVLPRVVNLKKSASHWPHMPGVCDG